MSDTLSHVRRVNRFLASQARKQLKNKMKGDIRISVTDRRTGETRNYRYGDYDSNVTMAPVSEQIQDYDSDKAKTTQDVIHETLELARSVNKSLRSRASQGDKADRLLREASVVQPEVREAWHAKINMSAVLSEDVKHKLRQQCNNPKTNNEPEYIRDMRLNALARAWVNAWLMAKLDLVNQERIPE